jgi:predicted TPR repeat methyltransferase
MNRKQRRASGSQGGSHQGTIADVAVFFNEALNYFRASQLREAESILNQILSSSPRHAESLHMLGVIEYQTGRAADAVKHMSQAVNLNNQQPSWHNNLGTVLNNLGKYKDAVAAYKSAIALKPDFHEAHTNLGDALKSLKKLDEAKASYESALALKPDYALALNGIGNILRDQAKPEEALTFYERAVTTAPGYAVAYYNMGTTFECMGKMDEAISYYKRGLEINPNNIETCVLLGRALQNRHQLHEAAELYQKALTLRENCIEAHFALGYIQHQLGNREAAIAHLNRCLEIDPQDQQFAGLLLAELTAKPLPEQAPDAFIQKIYAERALYWDRATAMEKSYQGHKLVADTLNRFYKDAQKLDILDAGCGTGLVGALIRGQARLLEGIDLSGERRL